MAIGARSQTARTFLEKNYNSEVDSLPELISQAIQAIRDSLPLDTTLTAEMLSISFIDREKGFNVISEEEISEHLSRLPSQARAMEVEGQPAAAQAHENQ